MSPSKNNVDISWYRSIFQNAREGITITDFDGNILLANNQAVSLFGYSNEEFLKKNIVELLKIKEDREVMLSKLIENGILRNYKVKVIPKSGETMEISMNHNAIYNPNGEIVAIHSSFADNTIFEETKRSLEEVQERYRILVEHAPEAITVLDPETMIFRQVNLKALELFKMSREELLNKSPVDLSPKHLPDGQLSQVVARNKVQEAVDGGKPIFDWIHIDANGKKIPCQIQLIRLPHFDKVLVRGSIIDMTEKIKNQKKLQESQVELAQIQKMEALGRLAGGVAHDFNNTLTAILGFCELLKLELADKKELFDMVHEIEKAGTKSTHLVKQLLRFGRKEEPKKELVNINSIIVETENLLRYLIGDNIKIEINLDNEIGNIEAHPTSITQILMNLAINAREAMPMGGTLTISTFNYMKMEEKGILKPIAILHVSDTGKGIEKEILDHIFEPFFTTKNTGTGLGLSTVYAIMKKLKGTVKVESTPNEGTTFQLIFPLSIDAKPPDKQELALQDKVILKEKKALIVEDDAQVRILVMNLLEEFGLIVTSTDSPIKAIELTKESTYDIIVSDMLMPEMSGIEMITNLEDQLKNLRVLFITAYINQPQLQKIMEQGYPILYKPFNRDSLFYMISQIFIDNP